MMAIDFNPTHDYGLENQRVLLKPLKQNDFDNLLPFAIYQPQLWRYSLLSAAGEAGMKKYIESALTAKSTGKEYPFIVFDKKTNEYAGCTRFYDIQKENQTLQLGFTWYGQSFQGTGLNRHCKYLLLQFAFEQLGIERVEFRADNSNARSIAAMKSIGCTVEGILRNHAPRPDGSRRDSIILSILKSEWEQHVKSNLLNKIGER